MAKENFYTFNEYMKKEEDVLTASMEDYLEMIYRLSKDIGFTRMNELSRALNVKPSSATKMVQKLAEEKMLIYEKYGIIILTEKGIIKGKFLLKRHNIIEGFLRILGVKDNILEETEKIEHTISDYTVRCFLDFIYFIDENPDIKLKLDQFRKDKKTE